MFLAYTDEGLTVVDRIGAQVGVHVRLDQVHLAEVVRLVDLPPDPELPAGLRVEPHRDGQVVLLDHIFQLLRTVICFKNRIDRHWVKYTVYHRHCIRT